ncbi:protein PLASTID MOVEMENT IMPAIRED 1-RELATED 1-like [Corylus avellana]|uniref:protein PLASTID MOVEMENT IMPAIRED 1-RELATED 1-like n=1 Tax=Corylus avellana TaxID=13451 RepID=UPI00286C71B2|nr:protein PLASTID MOVEMENT IMPAIRED 1-RELATED 1-like [Corylus avellana]
MLSKVEAGKKISEDSGNAKLLNEIEAISKALYVDKNPSRSLISRANTRSKSTGKTHLPDPKSKLKLGEEDSSRKDKKSIWNWRPLRALSHIRNRRFNCRFSLLVHSVEGLPSSFNDVSLCVHWKRRDGVLVTRPSKVFLGITEFEEKLTHTCSVYGSRSGPHHSAKYEAKHFLLYASVYGAPELDLGKHRIDLTRLLPLTLEELEEEKSSGTWTTSFKLSGKAKGAMMNVSFGYLVIGDNPGAPGNPEVLSSRQNSRSMAKAEMKLGQGGGWSRMHRAESLPGITNQLYRAASRSVENIKDLHEVLPISRSELASSVDILYRKFDEDMLDCPVDKPELNAFTEHIEPARPNLNPLSDSGKEIVETECEYDEFSVIEQGIELSSKESLESEEVVVKAANVASVESPDIEVDAGVQVAFEVSTELDPKDEETGRCDNELALHECASNEDDICTKEALMRELESALNNVSELETAALESPEDHENYMEFESDYKTNSKGKSLSLDDDTESIASEFLNMLAIEHNSFGLSSESEAESPRERLLRQFEEEALAGGCSLFDFDVGSGDQAEGDYNAPTGSVWGNLSEGFEFSSVIQDVEKEHQIATQAESSKTRAKILEDLETEALMREWGLNENAFQHSPPKSSDGFGSPINSPPEGPVELPPLGEGLGPFLQTKNGGFVRSMSPSVFSNAKNGGSLIMQVSSPVVIPAEMGSEIMEILQCLASVGIEKLSMQANKLMPLEDITGKTIQQVAWEAAYTLEGSERQPLLQHETVVEQEMFGGQKRVSRRSAEPRSNNSSSVSIGNKMGSEYVSLEDLAPLAMDKIEALSMEGLRIQSGMSDEDAPANISAKSIGDVSALQGKGINISGSVGLEGAAGLQLLDIEDGGDDVDGLMSLSLSLDEWMRLDSGEIDDDDCISERTSKILAAHHANSLDLIRGGSKGERRRGKGSSRKCGLLGNNFTVALMVQLRDPLRNYEPVGAPMLALIQVERVFVPPKPKIYSTVSEVRNSNEDDESESAVVETKHETKEEKTSEEEGIPQFKITEVHVAGLKTEPAKKKLWGTSTQQQSGSRWLVANGMGKNNKHPFMKSKAVAKSAAPATMKVQPGDTLWSISSRVHGTGAKWKDLAALNPHIRNPNIILPNETIRLR